MTQTGASKDEAAIEQGSTALVVGASGGLGAALYADLLGCGEFGQVLGLSRSTFTQDTPRLDLTSESSISACAAWVAEKCRPQALRWLVVASGYLHEHGQGPERSLLQLNAAYLQQVMAVNAIGPALLLKHFAPLLPRAGDVKLVFISAKVGSIGDNALGGWYGYRASKAALNQIVKTASIELARRNQQVCCVALHPGTVDTALSAPFVKTGLQVRSAKVAAQQIVQVIRQSGASQNGAFLDYQGAILPW